MEDPKLERETSDQVPGANETTEITFTPDIDGYIV